MSKGVSIFTTLVTSLIISVIVSAGLLFVAIPTVYPSYVDSSSLKFIQMDRIELNTADSIHDGELVFQKMEGMEMHFTIKNQSSIFAQFVGDFETRVYFVDPWGFEIALVIEGVGNRTAPMRKTGTSDLINQYDSHNIVITYLTSSLPAGNYTVGIYWRSIFAQPTQAAYLYTSYFDQNITHSNTIRTLTLWEIGS